MRKPPKLDHVKNVKRGQRLYAYFNTGRKTDHGTPIYKRLPDYSSASFFSVYAQLKAVREKRMATGYTVAHLVDEYRKSPDFTERAENTRKLYAVQLRKIVDAWGEFPIGDLEPADVRHVLDNEGWGAGTRNMVVAVLAVIYRWARRRGKTGAEPTKDIERAKGGQHDAWPEDVLNAALACDDPTIRLAVHLMAFTGLRIGDAMRLRWGDIRGDAIHITPQKTRRFKKHLVIPLLGELKAELDRTVKEGITVLHGIGERQLRIAMQQFTRALGAETVPHGLRKNAVNALLEAGCTIAEVAAITGQTFQVVEQYAAQVNRGKLGKAAILKWEKHRTKSA